MDKMKSAFVQQSLFSTARNRLGWAELTVSKIFLFALASMLNGARMCREQQVRAPPVSILWGSGMFERRVA